jgi:hypothetical protein
MIEYMSFIEARNPEFPHRILLVATGHADKYILNAFLADFRILGTMSPNVHPLQIDFKYVVDIPSYYVPYMPNSSTSVVVRQRKALATMLLFIIAFPDLNLPSGAYRIQLSGADFRTSWVLEGVVSGNNQRSRVSRGHSYV